MYCPACHDTYPDSWKVCPKDAASLLKFARIGKYEIIAPLGTGGMGAVYRAMNPDTQGEVAVKVMHPDVATSDSARQRFKREAAAVARLKTSHVVTVYDFGAEPDGTLYLVMELLAGHSLRDEITAPPDTIPLVRTQFIIDGVLKGLSAAHKAGIVHRDLKPENIFLAVTDDGEVPRLLDFGVARMDDASPNNRTGITRPGTVMGTAAYMPLEQLSGSVKEVGTWSDIYSIGAILYEMLTGRTQVAPGTLTDVVMQVMRGQLDPLGKLRPDLPAGLHAIVTRCLDKDAKRRPQTADELRAELVNVWGTVPAHVPPARRVRGGDVATTAGEPPATVFETVADGPQARAAAAGQAPPRASDDGAQRENAIAPSASPGPSTASPPPPAAAAPAAPAAPAPLGAGSVNTPASEPPGARSNAASPKLWFAIVGAVIVIAAILIGVLASS